MGEEIKSALELALERTAHIQSDKSKLSEHDNIQKGKRLASQFLHPVEDEDKIDLKSELKKITGKELQDVKRGLFDVILSNITLPFAEIDTTIMARLEEALSNLSDNKRQIASVFQQLNQFFEQYLQNKEQIRSSLEQQFAPRLREKSQALAQKMGGEIELKATDDPEFIEYLKQNYAQLDAQYQEALTQMKGQIREMIDGPAAG